MKSNKSSKKNDDCEDHVVDNCCEPSAESLKNILDIARRTESSVSPITTERIDAPSPDVAFSTIDGISTPDTTSRSRKDDTGKKHKTIYRHTQTFEYKNILGWVLDSITLKPTIWTPGGCKITKAELYINSNLGIGAKWIKKKVTTKIFSKVSENCQNKMDCAILEYDLEWEVAIRIGWLKLLKINVLTLNGFYQLCADGSVTQG